MTIIRFSLFNFTWLVANGDFEVSPSNGFPNEAII